MNSFATYMDDTNFTKANNITISSNLSEGKITSFVIDASLLNSFKEIIYKFLKIFEKITKTEVSCLFCENGT